MVLGVWADDDVCLTLWEGRADDDVRPALWRVWG